MLNSVNAYYAITIVFCWFTTIRSDGLSFNGFKQYRLVPMSSEAVARIHRLDREFPPEPNPSRGLTFLTTPGHKFEGVDLLVPPVIEAAFLTAVRSQPALRVQLVHKNFGRLVAQFNRQDSNSRLRTTAGRLRRTRRESQRGAAQESLMRHDFYRSFVEIRRALVELNDKCNRAMPGTCRLITIGTTYENRELIVLRISKNSPSGSRKTKIWLDSGIHAREWISHATMMYIADQLISGLTSNSNLTTSILDNHDIMMLPMYNPDGYEYSRLQNRLWRKNREPTSRRFCRGVDLNRNYGYMWGGRASVGFPCASNYRGAAAFSSAETAAVKQFVESERNDLLMFLSFHSYGQYLLIPFAHSRNTYSETHNDKMRCAAHVAIYSIYGVQGRFYSYGTGSDLLYEANGGSDDWAHGSAKIPYAFTFELPDEGDYGFLLPASRVPGVGHETLTGLRDLMDAVRRLEAGDPTMANVCHLGDP